MLLETMRTLGKKSLWALCGMKKRATYVQPQVSWLTNRFRNKQFVDNCIMTRVVTKCDLHKTPTRSREHIPALDYALCQHCPSSQSRGLLALSWPRPKGTQFGCQDNRVSERKCPQCLARSQPMRGNVLAEDLRLAW